MPDYLAIHQELARAIEQRDAQAEQTTREFLDGFISALPASFAISEGLSGELEAFLTESKARVAAAIEEGLQIGGQAGSLSDAKTIQLAEQAYSKTWPDGLKLSERVWRWGEDSRKGVSEQLRLAIAQHGRRSNTVLDMQRAIERSTGNVFEVVNRYQADWTAELAEKSLQLIHNPQSAKQWNETARSIAKHIEQLKDTGTKQAALRVFRQMRQAVETGERDMVANALNWWLYDKQLYNLKRIQRTEMATAAHNAIIESTLEDEYIIGYQWRLSGSHPVLDICDYYANVEFGLGRGVWPKDYVPRHKAHPHCMCILFPRNSRVKAQGKQTYAEFIQGLSPERQRILLPKWAREAMQSGTPLADLVRPDGFGLINKPSA